MPNQFDLTPDQIKFLTDVATHPAVRDVLKQINSAPPEERLATAERIATAETLATQGLTIPPGLKITTRYFEETNAVVSGEVLAPSKELLVETGMHDTVCVSVGVPPLCISYGYQVAE